MMCTCIYNTYSLGKKNNSKISPLTFRDRLFDGFHLDAIRLDDRPGPHRATDWTIGMEPMFNWVCLKMLCTPKPNGFADHYPY